jgi:uncharacterized membrane protein
MKKWSVRPRSIISIFGGGLVGVFLPSKMHWATRTLCIWDTGTICFLGLTWWAMIRATPVTIRRIAKQQDEGQIVILGLLTASACISLMAIGFLLHDKERGTSAQMLKNVGDLRFVRDLSKV